VPQQQILPAIACLQSSSVELGLLSRRLLEESGNPGAFEEIPAVDAAPLFFMDFFSCHEASPYLFINRQCDAA
jgi:hypothetical protein